MRGQETLVLEREASFGTGASSRNSEVIHAGIYYPQGSLKARLCVSGRDQLYRYCFDRGIEHRGCGKLIVATSESRIRDLERIGNAAADNGVALEWLDGRSALRLEPALACAAALHSPLTGIIDSHALMLALLGDAENHGATLVCQAQVTGIATEAGQFAVVIAGESEPVVETRSLINCAGFLAPQVASLIAGFPREHIPGAWLAKGNYFTLSGRSPFSRLIYPVPEPGGLGVHLTLDLDGRARFGPDVEWIEKIDYSVDPLRAERFYAAIRTYWPKLPDHSLMPGYAGIRAKISGPGEPAADFRIDGPADHGVRGLVNLFGIESPGLTASLAIGDRVASLLLGD